MRVWDLATGNCCSVLRGHDKLVDDVVFLPDGTHVLTSSWDRSLGLWRLGDGERVLTMRCGEHDLRGMAVTHDGRRCVVGDEGGTVWCWDLRTGRTVWRAKQHNDYVRRVAVSADEK